MWLSGVTLCAKQTVGGGQPVIHATCSIIHPMIYLNDTLNAWNTPACTEVLLREIEQMDVNQLPLQQCLTLSSYALDDQVKAVLVSTGEDAEFIRAKAGIFFNGMIPGCACADDPTPESTYSEYCMVEFLIDKKTAATTINLISDAAS